MRSGFTNFCAQSWAVTWAWAKTRAQQHPAGWQSCCMRHSNEAEWSKFLESCNGTLCPPPTQCNWEIQMYYLCSHLFYQGKKWFISWFLMFFPALITVFYCLVYSSSTLPCDVDSSTATLWAREVIVGHQELLLRTAPERKKPTDQPEVVSTNIHCWMTQGKRARVGNSLSHPHCSPIFVLDCAK